MIKTHGLFIWEVANAARNVRIWIVPGYERPGDRTSFKEHAPVCSCLACLASLQRVGT